MMCESTRLDFVSLHVGHELAVLTLNRPEVGNALNLEMLTSLIKCLAVVKKRAEAIRLLIVRGAGKHFCAGGDIAWMKKSVTLSKTENIREANVLGAMFSALYRVPVPTMAVVHGAAVGGGVGVVACCDWAIATDKARFGLGEVKLGVIASVILPYLYRRMLPGQLRRMGILACEFSPAEALIAGLIEHVVADSNLDEFLRQEVERCLAGSPHAQRRFKQLHQGLFAARDCMSEQTAKKLAETIAELRASDSGQKGLNAFLRKEKPPWHLSLPVGWKLPELPAMN